MAPGSDRSRSTVGVSVCTPTKDRPEFLERCIRSVKAQTHKNWQHVIYDVSDQPADVPNWSRIKYAYGKPQGPAVDFAISHSMADRNILTALSDDDELTPDALEVAVEALGDHDWLLAMTEIRDEQGNHICYRGGSEESVRSTMGGQYMLGGAIFWRKKFMRQVGPLNPDFDGAADFDFYARFIRHSQPVIIRDVLLIVTDHPGTDSRMREANQRFQSERIAATLI